MVNKAVGGFLYRGKMNKFTIEIEEIYNETNKDYTFLGDYKYTITRIGDKNHADTPLESGVLKEVMKFNEINAIVSCLAEDVNGDMFDE